MSPAKILNRQYQISVRYIFLSLLLYILKTFNVYGKQSFMLMFLINYLSIQGVHRAHMSSASYHNAILCREGTERSSLKENLWFLISSERSKINGNGLEIDTLYCVSKIFWVVLVRYSIPIHVINQSRSSRLSRSQLLS